MSAVVINLKQPPPQTLGRDRHKEAVASYRDRLAAIEDEYQRLTIERAVLMQAIRNFEHQT